MNTSGRLSKPAWAVSCAVFTKAKRYIVGYREGGTVAQKFAMWNPADIGGIATVDAPPVQQSYIDAAAQSLCPRLHNYVDEACSRSIKKSDIPMRAWFIDSKDVSDRPEVLHWRHANCDEPDARPIEMDTKGILPYQAAGPSARRRNRRLLRLGHADRQGI